MEELKLKDTMLTVVDLLRHIETTRDEILRLNQSLSSGMNGNLTDEKVNMTFDGLSDLTQHLKNINETVADAEKYLMLYMNSIRMEVMPGVGMEFESIEWNIC